MRNVYGVGSPTVGTTSPSVRLHIGDVTYMTEISLHEPLNTNKLKREPDRRSNFFSPPAYLCAVTYMTEISLFVTLNNKFNLIQKCRRRIGLVFFIEKGFIALFSILYHTFSKSSVHIKTWRGTNVITHGQSDFIGLSLRNA